jgi:benzodiazapine receptor
MRTVSDWGGNIAALVFVITVNGLANGLPIGGQTTGEISAKYSSLFTPAGFTFSIWGLIYLGLIAFVIYQSLPAQRNNASLARISPFFKMSCAANAIWIFAWHYDQLVMSLLLMAAILGALIAIYRECGEASASASMAERVLVSFPFSLYTGWITVALIANISAVQSGWGWNELGLTAIQWTWLKLAVAGTIGATVVAQRRDPVYILVIAWAAFGIFSKQSATPEVAGAAITLSMLAALLALIAIAIAIGGGGGRGRDKGKGNAA